MTPPDKQGRARWTRALAGLILGFLIGVFVHYLAYRYSLPSKPFIYVSF
jgi:hypothetical protein